MTRSVKKGPFVAYHLLKKIDAMNANGKKDISGISGEVLSSISVLVIKVNFFLKNISSPFVKLSLFRLVRNPS